MFLDQRFLKQTDRLRVISHVPGCVQVIFLKTDPTIMVNHQLFGKLGNYFQSKWDRSVGGPP